jgi:uncharacterized repeat protein (TIGR02543 family)
VRLDISVRGGLRPQVSTEGTCVAFLNESGGTALTYGGLKAWDADGKSVRSRFVADGATSIRIEADDESARYPITIDPVAQQAYLKAAVIQTAVFGSSVAVSGDTVVVGMPGYTTPYGSSPSGAAYVFVRSGTTWSTQARIEADQTGYDYEFGRSVAISGDTVVVGATGESSNATGVNGNPINNSAPGSGAAYVFVRSGTKWTQQAYLKASNAEAGDGFGGSVAVSADTVVVGSLGEDSNATGVNGNQSNNSASESGAAYVFVRSGTTWTQQAYLKASNSQASDHFGGSVSISNDTVVIGASGENSNARGVDGNQADNSAVDSGAAYVFVRSGTTWAQQAYLKASNTGTSDRFGSSTEVSGDTVVIGAPREDSNATGVNGNQADNSAVDSGAAYLFVRSGTTWAQQSYLKASNTETDDRFGSSTAVSGDTVVIGAPREDSKATGVGGNQADNSVRESGAAYAFIGAGPYFLSVTADHGIVEGSGYYNPSTTATLTVTAKSGYVFSGWTGDASGTDNPLVILMDSNKSIGANFAPDLSDSDEDGLSAYLEAVVYGTDPNLADTDGDGLSDGWEVGLGRYSIVAGSFTWQQARTDAKAKTGELASFPTEDRWNRAMETLGADALDPYTGLWIGADDAAEEGVWAWVNGEAFSFSVWATSRPSTTVGNTLDFVEVSGGDGGEIGKWYDRSPSTVRDGYILETGYATSPTSADGDGDGLNDGEEQAAGTNPFLADTDGDGLTDWEEVHITKTNPILADSDGNGVGDADEDSDGDGLTNLDELRLYGTDPRKADTDGDGLTDGFEVNYAGSYFQLVAGTFTYPQAAADAASKRGRVASFPNAADYSRMAARARQSTQAYVWIGLSDALAEGTWVWTNGSIATYSQWLAGEPSGGATENHVVIMENSTKWADTMETYVASGYLFERVGLDPLDPDTDGDGLTDGAEVNTHQTSPVLDDTDSDGLIDGAEINSHSSDPLKPDTDGDGLSDHEEVTRYGTNPALKDTDSDGFDDRFEIETGFDPTTADSTPEAFSVMLIAVEFRFNAAAGETYRIESSFDLENWDLVEDGIPGEGATVTRFYTIEAMPKRYFRARRN